MGIRGIWRGSPWRPRILVDQGGVWDPLDPNKTGGPFARSRKQEVSSRAIRLSNNWNLSSSLINTATFAYNRYYNPSLSTQSEGGWNKYLGLRWEQTMPYREKYGRWANFNPSITNTAYNIKGALEFLQSPSDSFEREKEWKEFSPRIGAAYRLTNKAVLRGGYGMFFIPIGIKYWSGVPYGFAPGYRSLQFMLTKRMSSGIAAQMSYNISKAVGNSETAFDETWDQNAGIQNIYNLAADAKTVLPYDQTHIVKGYMQYQLPFGRGRKLLSSSSALANAFLGGWDVTWVFHYNTGNPLGVSPNVWYPGWEGSVYADFNPSADLSRKFDGGRFNPGLQNDPGNLYFNQAAFSNPQNHKLGNGKRRYEELRGFGWASEDIGLLKYWRFAETANLQFRAEFINVFNRHYFANPNTGLSNTTNFGYVTGMTGTPRNVQFGLRLGF